MNDRPQILEYASPLSFLRATARPASVSEVVRAAAPDVVRYTEWPLGRNKAFFGIGFALLTMAVLGGMTLSQMAHLGWGKVQREFGLFGFLTLFWIVEGIVLAMVIARSWRQTVLEARPGVLRVRTPAVRHEWPAAEVPELDVYYTGRTIGGLPLAEVQIRFADTPTLRLFVDQPEARMERLVAEVRSVVGVVG